MAPVPTGPGTPLASASPTQSTPAFHHPASALRTPLRRSWVSLVERLEHRFHELILFPLRLLEAGRPGEEGRGVYLPAHLQAVSFPLSAGGPLKCASLLGLRNELAELAERWDLPLDDVGLQALLRVARDPDDGWVADPTEILTFARLALAANEAMRRDCPLWLVGGQPT